MITITNAMEYSTQGELAYQITYSDGTNVRAVLARDGWIRKEYKNAKGEWKIAGKPYLVKKNSKRQGERVIKAVKAWLQ